MIASAHQPQYLPYLGHFDKIDRSDLFVLMDNVQYKKNDWQNRNRIKTAGGWQWLTVPVLYKFPEKINQVRINHREKWSRKHLQALISNYSKAQFFKDHIEFWEEFYSREWEMLTDVNIEAVRYLSRVLGIQTETVIGSQMDLGDDQTGRLVDMCLQLGADTYLAGAGAVDYMDVGKFEEAGIEVIFQDFRHPQYRQLFGEFEPYMSAVDLIFNCGDKSLDIIREGQ